MRYCPNNTYITGYDKKHALYEYQTDQYRRITHVEGTLEQYKGKRNEYAQSKAGREDRITQKMSPEDFDDGGHLIATIFNGDGNLANLVPMNNNLNRGAWEAMERDWNNLLDNGYDVYVDITVNYAPNSDSLRPISFNIEATIMKDGNFIISKIDNFQNKRGEKYKNIGELP